MYTIRNKTTGQMIETTPMTVEQIERWWKQDGNEDRYFGYGIEGEVVEVVETEGAA